MSHDAHKPNVPRSLGRYEIVGFLASGGMAEVFLARVRGPSGFERPVVLKRMLPHLTRQASFVNMFLDEARILARVRHPSVVQVQELTNEGGELFMVMEYLEGETLAGLSRRLIARGEALDPAIAAHVIAEACAGLHAAHELRSDDGLSLGVVHRDVSPQNLFVTFAGSVKILDFGIAKAQDRVTRTETGDLKGKLDYMSPEQCMSKDVDRRSDVFSLGVVLYELLTLRRLYKRPTPLATLKAITEEPVVPPSRLASSCPKALDSICLRALARDPGERYATAADMRRDLLVAMRATADEGLPEEHLAQTMLRIFADRKQEKEEMLRRVREGDHPTFLPAPEADDLVEIPVVDAPRTTGRSRRMAVVIVTAIVAVSAVAVALASKRAPAPITATPRADSSTSLDALTPQVQASAESVPLEGAPVPPPSADHRAKARAPTPAVPTSRAKVDVDPLHTKW
jgi:eukaryotic-like serine/threonine-protein kinase